MRHIIPISGKDSLATALIQLNKEPNLPYEYVFNPTGADLPIVFDWLKNVELYLDKEIVFIGENLEEIIQDYNYFLPSRQSRYCTRRAKIEPFEKWIGKDDCIVYYGIRADEKRIGYNAVKGNIQTAYPLIDAGFGIKDVYRLINEYGLKPPSFFWQSVYDEAEKQIGADAILPLLTEWQKDILFAWRTRSNCYFCFNQRRYEWIGLLEHYPDLFWKAEKMEHLGADKIYTWNSSISLSDLASKAEEIKARRIKVILKILNQLRQGKLFSDDEDGFIDIFKSTSCGLFCGK